MQKSMGGVHKDVELALRSIENIDSVEKKSFEYGTGEFKRKVNVLQS